jgi:hypothetical protein
VSERDFSTRPRRRSPDGLDAVALALGGLSLVVATYWTTTASTDLRRAREHAAEARREADADRGRLRALESRRGAEGTLGTQALLTADAPPPRVVADLGTVMPADVRLESLRLTYADAVTVEMQVAARAPSAYDAFLQRLEGSPLFADVAPGDESRSGDVRASVRATYRPRPGARPSR